MNTVYGKKSFLSKELDTKNVQLYLTIYDIKSTWL